MSRITQIFYGNDCLPYKDSERTVHYPITGCSFAGSSNVNELHFYTRDIGGVNNLSWVAIVKLPNGKILYQLLTDIHLDSEINEYYVSFNLSSFYTQLKGDIYISLNGCLGQVEIETDEETDISTIQGEIDSKTIVATGAVKFTINYAPQRPIGYSFDLDQYQLIINALADKANIVNTIQVIANISSEDLSKYDNGQLFYDLANKVFYEKDTSLTPNYKLVDGFGILAKDHLVPKLIVTNPFTGLDDIFTIVGDRLLVVRYSGNDYLFQRFVTGTVSAFRLGTLDFWHAEDSELNLTIGQLLQDQNKFTYLKQKYTNNTVYGINATGEQVNIYYSVLDIANALVQRDADGFIKIEQDPLTNNDAVNKKYVDDLISSIKENELQVVSELPAVGEEGIIYLLPIDPLDSTKGYYRYIWENNTWLSLGTTEIDLSDYYTKEEVDGIKENINANVPKHQTNTVLIVNPLTNINGRTFQSYTSENVTIGGYPAVRILRNGNRLNEQHAKEYMEYMCGSYYLPKYNYDYPKNTYFIMPNGQLLKPQYDNTNGLLLFYAGRIATTDYAVEKTSQAEKVYGTDELGAQATYDVDSDLVGDGEIVRRESGTGTIVTGNPTSNTHATTKNYVDTLVRNAISNVYKIKGSATVSQINAMTNQQVGDVYNVTDSGTIVLGDLQVFTGDNIVWTGSAWDKLGAEIDWTAYDEKFIAAGFFEVQPYNEETGEITFVYSTELYIMSYDTDTGVLTISAN